MLNLFRASAPRKTPLVERYELIERFTAEGVRQSFLARDLHSSEHQARCVVEEFIFPIQWIEGYPLEKILTASAPLSDQQVVVLLRDLLCTVSHIYRHGVLHLNLQPSNLLCERNTHCLVATNFGGFQQRSAQLITPASSLDEPEKKRKTERAL